MTRLSPLFPTLLAAACATAVTPDPAPPPVDAESAYAAAVTVALPDESPETHSGLHNLYRLSPSIVSGSEPEGDAAFAKLAELGVRTILSVDGKVPDAAAAARHGLRYVHVPIRYRGFERDEQLAIAKTFRELDGPFYVHCFHGRHRGPAAAAIGRVLIDGASRHRALAEMRQWCGTSDKYDGLYATIAFDELPTAAETRAYDFDFSPSHRFAGFRQAMIEAARSWDTIVALSERDWRPNPNHPDASALSEAARLADIFANSASLDDAERAADFQAWLGESERDARELATLLRRDASGDANAGAAAQATAKRIKAACTACHQAYRN